MSRTTNRYLINKFKTYRKIDNDPLFVPAIRGKSLIYTVNPAHITEKFQYWSEICVGCEFNCLYCLARATAMQQNLIRDYSEWNRPKYAYPEEQILSVFEREIKHIPKGKIILHSMTSDPFFNEKTRRIYNSISEIVNDAGLINRFLTKGVYQNSNLDPDKNIMGISLSFLDTSLQRKIEIGSPTPAQRIKGLKLMMEDGFTTTASITGFPLKNTTRNIHDVLESINFVDEITFDSLSYYGFLKEEDLEFYYEQTTKIFLFCQENGINFYTTGDLNSYIREKTSDKN